MRLPRRLKWALVIALIIGMPCSCVSVWLLFYLTGEQSTCWEAQNLPYFVLESDAHFKLPPSAQSIYRVTYSYWSSCTMGVKFAMQPADLNQFVASTRVASLSSTVRADEFLSQRSYIELPLGVNLVAMKSYLFGSLETDYFNQQHLLVDTSDSNVYVAYLVTEEGFLD